MILVFGMVSALSAVSCVQPALGDEPDPDVAVAAQASGGGCPYQTVQARVQPNISTPWTQTISISPGTSLRMAGFFNQSGLIDTTGNTSLALSGPGVSLAFANDSTFAFSAAGTYTLTAICGAASDRATITVAAGGCPYQTIQTRVQPDIQTPWAQSAFIVAGQTFHVGVFFNGTGQLAPNDTTLTVVRPDGTTVSPANGAFVASTVSGVYAVNGACGSMHQSAAVIAQ